MLFKNKFLLFFVISVGSVIGIVRGEEAKQKWVFRIKSKVDYKKLIAEKKRLTAEVEFSTQIVKVSEACTDLLKEIEAKPDPFHDPSITNPYTKKSGGGGCTIL